MEVQFVVQLVGPISTYGDEYRNIQAFVDMAGRLRSTEMYEVINPTENFGGRRDLAYETYMAMSLTAIEQRAQGIALLPGWDKSKGALREVKAAARRRLPVMPAELWERDRTGGEIAYLIYCCEAELTPMIGASKEKHPAFTFLREPAGMQLTKGAAHAALAVQQRCGHRREDTEDHAQNAAARMMMAIAERMNARMRDMATEGS